MKFAHEKRNHSLLDELHAVVGAGGTEGGMDAANILKPALARASCVAVGATTYDEYRERIEKDGRTAGALTWCKSKDYRRKP